MKLKREFYLQSTLKVAQNLLGKFLIHKIGPPCRSPRIDQVETGSRGEAGKKKIIGMITETEAYVGPRDKASHASRGRTARTELMFGLAGHAYIYLIYGMYYCFNVVTERKDYPAAVLVRGIRLVGENTPALTRLQEDIANGPGKVCRFMKIDKKLNGIDLYGNVLWIEDRGVVVKRNEISRGKRVGVDYAGEYKNKMWRFYLSLHQNK